jgi:flagellar biosynthetic protein FlhB
MADRDQRTEQPTQQRVRKSRDEGRFAVSREFVAGVQFLVFVSLMASWSEHWFQQSLRGMRSMILDAFRSDVTSAGLVALALKPATPISIAFFGTGSLVMGVVLMSQLTVSGFGFATAKLVPDLNRASPLSNLKELPSRNRRAFLEAVLLLPVFLGICWAIISAQIEDYLRLPLMPSAAAAGLVGASISELLWKAASVFLVWGAIDLFRQRKRFQSDLKMTKQEVRDESRQNEGNPEIKMKIRRLRRELLRRRMMAEVPTATAVIVNPTHFAVALRYDLHGASAPRVVAKGKNFLALRIREKAISHQVPVIENPPLAQALYKHVEVGQEIPSDLYRAVAEVLAYVFRLMRGGLSGV